MSGWDPRSELVSENANATWDAGYDVSPAPPNVSTKKFEVTAFSVHVAIALHRWPVNPPRPPDQPAENGYTLDVVIDELMRLQKRTYRAFTQLPNKLTESVVFDFSTEQSVRRMEQ